MLSSALTYSKAASPKHPSTSVSPPSFQSPLYLPHQSLSVLMDYLNFFCRFLPAHQLLVLSLDYSMHHIPPGLVPRPDSALKGGFSFDHSPKHHQPSNFLAFQPKSPEYQQERYLNTNSFFFFFGHTETWAFSLSPWL